MVTRIKAVTVLASFIAWVLVAYLPAYANGIAAWSCVNDAGNQKLILTTASPVSPNAKVAIDGVEQSSAVSVSGNTVTIGIDGSISCVGRTITITDNGNVLRVL